MRSSFPYPIFFTLAILISLTSCKKEGDSGKKSTFTFEIDNSVYKIDSLVFLKIIDPRGPSDVYLMGYSKNGKYRLQIECKNNVDSTTLGNYSVASQATGYLNKIVPSVYFSINDNPDGLPLVLDQLEKDFIVNITYIDENRIAGNFSGHVTGGLYSCPTCPVIYTEVRTSKISGQFDCAYYHY